MSDIVEKLAKVLNQAENASTQEEADAFLKAAQALSTKYSISLAEARKATAKKEQRETPTRGTVDLTAFARNTKKHLVELFCGIGRANDVRADVAMDSSRLYPYGFPSDLEITEILFTHLAMQMVEEANKYLETGQYKEETVTSFVRFKHYVENKGDGYYYGYKSDEKGYYYWDEKVVEKPVDGRVARSNFYKAFIRRVVKRLEEAKDETVAAAEAETTGTELVLADKAKDVHSYYRQTSNARGSWKGASTSGYSSSASGAGKAAGSRARLSGQSALGGNKAIGS